MVSRKVRVGKDVEFGPKCRFEGRNYLARGTYLSRVKMGRGSYVGMNCMLRGVLIGRYTCIGSNVTVALGRHPIRDYVSIHPAFFSKEHPIGFSYVKKNKFEQIQYVSEDENKNRYAVEIGNDVWIGSSVTITDGVIIGDGAIVGAGSLVLKDVKPYSIVAGVPAKEIRKRFSESDIRFLQKTSWWRKDEKWINNMAYSFDNMALFKKCCEDDLRSITDNYK